MYRAAVVGKHDDILAYKAIGLAAFDVQEQDFRELIRDLERQQYAVIFVIEDVYSANIDIVDRYSDSVLPAIIAIPGISGSSGMGMLNIKKCTERAIGADIVLDD